jgi:hypothetical protein
MVFKIITIVLLILILNQHEFDLWAPFNKIVAFIDTVIQNGSSILTKFYDNSINLLKNE